MNLPNKVYLLGLPGSGKSTIGRHLSELLNYPFFDLDTQIEKEEGISIPDIFKKKGEKYFRNLEAKKLKEISEEKRFILAVGGGTPCFHSNIELINKTGTSVYLKVSIDEIVSRLEKQKNRPIFNNSENLKDQVLQLLSNRDKFYKQAKIIIESDNVSAEEVLTALEQ